jgi:hypothetical protein
MSEMNDNCRDCINNDLEDAWLSFEYEKTITILRSEITALTAENERLKNLVTLLQGNPQEYFMRWMTVKNERDALTAERDALLEAEEAGQTCTWKPDSVGYEWGNCWESQCGLSWSFIDDGPAENNMNFCPFCGGRLVIAEPPPDAEEVEE